MTSLLERADIDSGSVRVGAALYREQGVVIFDLQAYRTKKEIIEAIDRIPFNFKSSRASLAAGINVVRDQMFENSAGDRPDIPTRTDPESMSARSSNEVMNFRTFLNSDRYILFEK
jgi:hypothetical protein